MRVFEYESYDANGSSVIERLTEDQIKDEFWEKWQIRMESMGRPELVSWENCLRDWVTSKWAWEVADDDGE